MGKGGNERCLPLTQEVVRVLSQYRAARGPIAKRDSFFRSRGGRGLSRNAVYDRVRRFGRRAKIQKVLSKKSKA